MRFVVLHIALLGFLGCSVESERSQKDRLESRCLQRGLSTEVCACASDAMAQELTAKTAVALEAAAIAQQLDRHIARCMISTGGHTVDIDRDCNAVAPLTQKRREVCACAAPKIARDERVTDILERAPLTPFPGWAEESVFACAYETGAIDALLANICGGTRESPHCVCLRERFTADFSPTKLAGMSSETLHANASDIHERCMVDAPHVRDGLMKACEVAEKKKSVCVCAVEKFLKNVPLGDVLTILQNGWTTDTMFEMNVARRSCGGAATRKR
jgi:hypothetical protein